jgi:hypothetical protein
MRAKEYLVLERAVEEGMAYGITRVFKHLEHSQITEDELRDASDKLVAAVTNSICEWFDFPEPGTGHE